MYARCRYMLPFTCADTEPLIFPLIFVFLFFSFFFFVSDDKALTSPITGARASRDIVQFVSLQ
jgi:hypothetical protein